MIPKLKGVGGGVKGKISDFFCYIPNSKNILDHLDEKDDGGAGGDVAQPHDDKNDGHGNGGGAGPLGQDDDPNGRDGDDVTLDLVDERDDDAGSSANSNSVSCGDSCGLDVKI